MLGAKSTDLCVQKATASHSKAEAMHIALPDT